MIKKVLVVDDESTIRRVLKFDLEQCGFKVFLAKDVVEALELFRINIFDVLILDVRMPGKDGFYALRKIKRLSQDIVIIMMTAYATIDGAVKAMKMGADDYISKPFDIEELIKKIEQHIKIKTKRQKQKSNPDNYESILIGSSAETQLVKNKINKVKNLETTVLITGESGTGKGIVAKEIHNSGRRKNLPFIHVDCAFLPPNLIESELFGYEKGAFTDASTLTKGKFELSGKGTIFLDEIGTLPLALQSKLLNVLQERYIYRIGGSEKIPIESRIIAATNENLEKAIRELKFREDLFYRLNVVRVECPPLRYRKEDIIELTYFFFEHYKTRNNIEINNIEEDVWEVLLEYEWPGNVRELENAIESAIVLCEDLNLKSSDLPLRIKNNKFLESPKINSTELSLKEQEMMLIIAALEKNKGHREKTAKELGISRRTLQYKLKELNIT